MVSLRLARIKTHYKQIITRLWLEHKSIPFRLNHPENKIEYMFRIGKTTSGCGGGVGGVGGETAIWAHKQKLLKMWQILGNIQNYGNQYAWGRSLVISIKTSWKDRGEEGRGTHPYLQPVDELRWTQTNVVKSKAY